MEAKNVALTRMQGVTVGELCSNIRKLSSRRFVLILCSQKHADPDSLEVTIVSVNLGLVPAHRLTCLFVMHAVYSS